MVFLSNDVVVVGGESPRAEVHSLIEKRELRSWECHDTRLRCMSLISHPDRPGGGLLVTASSSDHMIKVWDVSNLESEVECVASVDTACRVTAMTIWHPDMTRAGKKKKKRKTESSTVDLSPTKKIRDEEIINEAEVEDSEVIDDEVSIVESKLESSKRKKKLLH